MRYFRAMKCSLQGNLTGRKEERNEKSTAYLQLRVSLQTEDI